MPLHGLSPRIHAKCNPKVHYDWVTTSAADVHHSQRLASGEGMQIMVGWSATPKPIDHGRNRDSTHELTKSNQDSYWKNYNVS